MATSQPDLNPRLSPDGAWIAYTRDNLTRFPAIRLVHPDGSGDRKLTDRNGGTASSELEMQEIDQDLEGIGRVQNFFVDIEDLPPPATRAPDASLRRRLGNSVAMIVGGLPHVFSR